MDLIWFRENEPSYVDAMVHLSKRYPVRDPGFPRRRQTLRRRQPNIWPIFSAKYIRKKKLWPRARLLRPPQIRQWYSSLFNIRVSFQKKCYVMFAERFYFSNPPFTNTDREFILQPIRLTPIKSRFNSILPSKCGNVRGDIFVAYYSVSLPVFLQKSSGLSAYGSPVWLYPFYLSCLEGPYLLDHLIFNS